MPQRVRLIAPLTVAAALAVAASGFLAPTPAHAADALAPRIDATFTPSDSNGDGVVGDVGDSVHLVYAIHNVFDAAGYSACTVTDSLIGWVGDYVTTVPAAGLPQGSSVYKTADRTVTAPWSGTFMAACKDKSGGAWHSAATQNASFAPSAAPSRSLSLGASYSASDANGDGVTGDAGDQLAVTYTIGNSGSQTLAAPALMTASGAIGTDAALTAGSSVPVPRTVTIHAGSNELSAHAEARTTTPDNVLVASPTWAGAFIAAASPRRELAIAPTAGAGPTADDTNADGVTGDAGDVVAFPFTVVNTGDQALGQVTATSGTDAVSGPSAGIGAGASQPLSLAHTITAADVAAGAVSAHATARARTTTPDQLLVTASFAGPAPSFTPAASPVRALTLALQTSVDDSNHDGVSADAGDVATLSYTISNTGNQPLDGVSISSRLFGSIEISGELAPAAARTVSHSYTITAADVVVGSVPETATATASTTSGPALTLSSQSVQDTIRTRGDHGGLTPTADLSKPGSNTDSQASGASSVINGGNKPISTSFGFGYGAVAGLPASWPEAWTTPLTKIKTATPAISSTVKIGQKLQAAKPVTHTVLRKVRIAIGGRTVTEWVRVAVAPRYQWYANGKAIRGATRSALTITAALTGKHITVKTNGAKGRFSIALVASRVGATLTAHLAGVPKGAKIGYQWYADGKALKTGIHAAFKVPASLKGKRLTVKAAVAQQGYAITTSKASAKTGATQTAAKPAPKAVASTRLAVALVPGKGVTLTAVKVAKR